MTLCAFNLIERLERAMPEVGARAAKPEPVAPTVATDQPLAQPVTVADGG